jgi:hypothetical protein
VLVGVCLPDPAELSAACLSLPCLLSHTVSVGISKNGIEWNRIEWNVNQSINRTINRTIIDHRSPRRRVVDTTIGAREATMVWYPGTVGTVRSSRTYCVGLPTKSENIIIRIYRLPWLCYCTTLRYVLVHYSTVQYSTTTNKVCITVGST